MSAGGSSDDPTAMRSTATTAGGKTITALIRDKACGRTAVAYPGRADAGKPKAFNEHIRHLHGSTHLLCGQFWSDPPNFYVFRDVSDVEDIDGALLRNEHLATAPAPR